MDDCPGLRGVIQKIKDDYNLPISSQMGEKRLRGVYRVAVEKKKAEAKKMLKELQPGLWLWVCHIGIESPEQDALIHSAAEDIFEDGVGRHRAAELAVVTSSAIKRIIWREGIKLIIYRELVKEERK